MYRFRTCPLLALMLSLACLSSCVEREAVKVDMNPVVDAVADLKMRVDAIADTKISVDAIAAAVVSKQASTVEARDIGQDAPGRDKNTTNLGWEAVAMAYGGYLSGPLALFYYIWVHRPRRIAKNGGHLAKADT